MNVNKRTVMGFGAMLMAGQVNAATIFAPTDGDVNFLADAPGIGVLAMFDDSDQAYMGNFLAIPLSSIVGISGPTDSGDYIAVNEASETLTLTGSNNFILGFSYDGVNWTGDTSIFALGANSYSIDFDTSISVLTVDIQPVPVPAAVWLFGSGLLGLVGIARRQSQV